MNSVPKDINSENNDNPLFQDIRFAAKVGPKISVLLNRLGIYRIIDLFLHIPREYSDRRKVSLIKNIQPGLVNTTCGIIESVSKQRIRKGLNLLKVIISDDSGKAELVWFNQSFLQKNFIKGRSVIITAKAEMKFNRIQFNNPEYEIISDGDDITENLKILPVYDLTEGLSQKILRNILYENLLRYKKFIYDSYEKIFDYDKIKLFTLKKAIEEVHFPESVDSAKKGRERLKFDELLNFHLLISLQKIRNKKENKVFSYNVNFESTLKEFEEILPFRLTKAQINAVNEIFRDLNNTSSMNRLIQGDVGSGKTIVAVFSAYFAVKNGFQVAIMAPTEILANQHYKTLRKILENSRINCGILTSSLKQKEKNRLLKELKEGKIQILSGTHSMISENVEFNKLSLVIVDEQHKFGVVQRAKLRDKAHNPDMLVMSATPIPRSLALTFYGDLDISTIDEMPQGRLPVISYMVSENNTENVFSLLKNEVDKGRQAYIIYPLIEESDKIEARSVIQEAEKLSKTVFENYETAVLHGRLKQQDKERIMSDFKNGKIRILFSTTVIEVGVDNPNASVMVLFHSERYGLSQLHQMRGRVGRGSYQSYCIFVAKNLYGSIGERLKILCSTVSGFKIAEEDLRIRGQGDYAGIRQHGISEFKIADMIGDQKLSQFIKKIADRLVLREDIHKITTDSLFYRIKLYENMYLNLMN